MESVLITNKKLRELTDIQQKQIERIKELFFKLNKIKEFKSLFLTVTEVEILGKKSNYNL